MLSRIRSREALASLPDEPALGERRWLSVRECVCLRLRASACVCSLTCVQVYLCLFVLQCVNLTLQSDDSATVQYDAQMCQVRGYLFG